MGGAYFFPSSNHCLFISFFKSTAFFKLDDGEKSNGDDLFSMSNFVRRHNSKRYITINKFFSL